MLISWNETTVRTPMTSSNPSKKEQISNLSSSAQPKNLSTITRPMATLILTTIQSSPRWPKTLTLQQCTKWPTDQTQWTNHWSKRVSTHHPKEKSPKAPLKKDQEHPPKIHNSTEEALQDSTKETSKAVRTTLASNSNSSFTKAKPSSLTKLSNRCT